MTQYGYEEKIPTKTIFPEGFPSNERLQLEKLVSELKKHYPKIPVIAMTMSDVFGFQDEEKNKPYAQRKSILNSKEVDAVLDLSRQLKRK